MIDTLLTTNKDGKAIRVCFPLLPGVSGSMGPYERADAVFHHRVGSRKTKTPGIGVASTPVSNRPCSTSAVILIASSPGHCVCMSLNQGDTGSEITNTVAFRNVLDASMDIAQTSAGSGRGEVGSTG